MDGWFKKLNWVDVTDLQQAQYLVRAFILFSEKDVQRAYMYYYDDNNGPSVHASSGLTRNFIPKMSFWAVKQLYETLGEYRFNSIIKKTKDQVYVYEYVHGSDSNLKIWVIWSPTNNNNKQFITLSGLPGKVIQSTVMSTEKDSLNDATLEYLDLNRIRVEITESPTYLTFANY